MRQMLSMFHGGSIVVGFVDGFETTECDVSVQGPEQSVIDGMVPIRWSIDRSRLGYLCFLLALFGMGRVLEIVDVLSRCADLIGQIVQGLVHDDR